MNPIPYAEAIDLLAKEERGAGWQLYCEREVLYQLPVIEWLDALASEFQEIRPERPVEIGSGTGVVGRALRSSGIPLILTDPEGGGEIEALGFDEALAQKEPDLVFSCWLPFNLGAEKLIFATPSVRWYLAVVQTGPGYAGSEALWGAPGWRSQALLEVNRWSVSRPDYLSQVDKGEHVRHGAAFLFTREG